MEGVPRKIMVVAGEASGDRHGAKLVDALSQILGAGNVRYFGSAGPKMRASGVEPIVLADGLSIVGLVEIARALPLFWRAFSRLKRAAEDLKPDVVILVDFPDFNLKLARSLKKRGFKIVYYISPQLWAWRGYRLRTVKRYVDLMLTILPFEKEWYRRRGFERVEYVGSPLAREVHANLSRDEFRAKHGFERSVELVALLPGSRHKEIVRILPLMLDAAAVLREHKPTVKFVVAVSSEANLADAGQIIESRGMKELAHVVLGETYDAVAAADAAAVTSGTATLETGILGTPMAVVYRTSSINYGLLEPIIDVPHYGLINLIAEKRIAKELIQSDFTSESLAAELKDLLEPERNAAVREELKQAAEKLGQGGASRRAAEAIARLIN